MQALHLLPLIAISATVTILAKFANKKTTLFLFKPLTTLLIILIAFIKNFQIGTTFGLFILLGLFASLIGDIFLLSKSDENFKYGLGAFFLAHVFYITAFIQEVQSFNILLLFPFLVFSSIVYFYLRPGLGRIEIPVMIYIAIISLMVFFALNKYILLQNQSSMFSMIGAILFLLSDSILAINKFKKSFSSAEWFILVFYFSGQTLIAFSI